jgi:protein involved in polysaccharide export with SLBB domain
MLLLLFSPAAQAAGTDYVLGSGDRVRLKVLEWRVALGEPYEWPGLSGEFEVGSSGTISVPMLGEIPAAGSTTAGLAERVSSILQTRVRLVQRPDTSAEVAKYRPVYVVGDVEKPGEYPYRPGMNVIEAVSVASGLYRGSDRKLDFEHDAILARGNLRTLSAERRVLLVRRARLEAELENRTEIAFDAELLRSADAMENATREERLLFESRRDATRSQIEGLDQIRGLLLKETETLRSKISSQEQQASLNRAELESINGLVARGLAVTSRKLGLEQNAAQFESTILDLKLAVLRAQQDINKADRDKLEILNLHRNGVLTELATTRAKITENVEKIETEQKLLYEAETAGPRRERSRENSMARSPAFQLLRGSGEPMQAQETDTIAPGDVLKVILPAPARDMADFDSGALADSKSAPGTR